MLRLGSTRLCKSSFSTAALFVLFPFPSLSYRNRIWLAIPLSFSWFPPLMSWHLYSSLAFLLSPSSYFYAHSSSLSSREVATTTANCPARNIQVHNDDSARLFSELLCSEPHTSRITALLRCCVPAPTRLVKAGNVVCPASQARPPCCSLAALCGV
ncbi:hypothetical protein BCV69DRAFT_202961 [Microstroma glucosiphilum]|uniref:Uncharacterized protein n=1 Tax=Pseudomicrostroma glucosiphilum TaxID=1684307 RepID=A0A316U4N5_9BASI|nr:hypothetical protein BCV69DRAFT_202961 [Pseudomicrostroma glucosiphilum]PWN20207.1 hypothetical protein BCV69DRAFT_202961 [Pseudomicrostroma glucosiphilum]